MNNYENSESQISIWRCSGKKDHPHLAEIVISNDCPVCGKKRPTLTPIPDPQPPINGGGGNRENLLDILLSLPKRIFDGSSYTNPSTTRKSKRNRQLFATLSVLNIISGYTTMQGAAQVLPRLPGYTAGATIQLLLFILLSSKDNREHLPKLVRWLVIGSLSLLSVYTSFFTYYGFITAPSQSIDRRERARTAHQNLVSDVFTPIEGKVEDLKSAIKSKELQIETEIEGKRKSGQLGCGKVCQGLKGELENLQIKLNQDSPVVTKLKPLFNYDAQDEKPQEIFSLDQKALAAVKRNCLPSKPDFVCLPDKYVGALDTKNPKHSEFEATYIDPELKIGLLAPFLKIKRGEVSAIGAATIALLIDGCIILLGLGIDAPKKRKKLPLKIKGNGSEFLDELSESINRAELTINFQSLQNTRNSREYLTLLQNLFTLQGWCIKDEDEQQWQIVSDDAYREFISWINEQRQEQLRLEHNTPPGTPPAQSGNMIELLLPE